MHKFDKTPVISISIPTYNEESNIKLCLDSINNLNYPKNKIEVFVIDGGSTDNTLQIAKKYSFVKIIHNPEKDTHIGKMLGLKKSRGKYWTYFDADLQANGKEWANAMVYPLEKSRHISASVSRYHGRNGDSMIERYVNLDPIGRDTLFAWFTPSIESTITSWENGYAICKYTTTNIPPEGRCLFRVSQLRRYLKKDKRFRELDTLLTLTRNGHETYAYVPNPGYYHRHPQTLSELHRKRKRNTVRNYIPGSKEGYVKYKWFELENKKDFAKMLLLVAYSFSILGPLVVGIYKSLKHKNIAGLMEFVYVPVATEAYIEAFISKKDGREFLLTKAKKLIKKLV